MGDLPLAAPGGAPTVALLTWRLADGIGEMLCHELTQLGYRPLPFVFGSPLPEPTGVLLSFGPYGPVLPVWQQAARLPAERRPVVVHWNTEGMPDPRWPKPLMRALAVQASRFGRLAQAVPDRSGVPKWARQPLHTIVEERTSRFRYTGDYLDAYQRGWLHVLADTSAVYARLRATLGLPTLYAPWGATPIWYADQQLVRDIDVLWMGTRGSPRRSYLLDRIRRELQTRGVRLHVADGVENPFIFGATRTRYLNRAKITLNLTRTWYDDNFSRFAVAATNRSLIVSEQLLSHCPEFESGRHYVSAPISRLADTIVHYLHHEDERRHIVEQAYHLLTIRLVFGRTLQSMLETALKRPPSQRLVRELAQSTGVNSRVS